MTTDSLSPRLKARKHLLFSSVLIITGFSLGGQVVRFTTEIVAAALFGAGAAMDAYLAANTLPQYVMAVLLSSLGFVFIPVFVEHLAEGQKEQAWEIASVVVNLSVLLLGGLIAVGSLFSAQLLQVTTPGLSPASLILAVQVARITWPAVLATALLSLLTGIYHAQGHFGWPAAVPVIGAIVSLGLTVLLAPVLGVVGLAIGVTTGVVLQVLLLSRVIFVRGRYRASLNLRHPGVLQVLRLLAPLVISGLLVRSTPVVDRYLASSLSPGSISHLGYAFRTLALASLLISSGLAVVIFPSMARYVATLDIPGLKQTMSMSLRLQWLAVAPVMAIGGVIALPAITAVFQRGQFSGNDAEAVAVLVRVYLPALAGMCLANITGRSFYALKDTRTPAIIGVFEALAYAVYTPFLTQRLGAPGVALGYVIYMDVSIVWQVLVLRHKTGNTGGRTVLGSFARTALAAGWGGTAAWAMMAVVPGAWLQFLLGGTVGLVVYAAALLALRSSEAQMVWGVVRQANRAAVGGTSTTT